MRHLGRETDVMTRDSLHGALLPVIEAAAVRALWPDRIAVLGAG
jgi:hypothetical protein